ncbi:MAG: hypothetical protein ACPG4X_19290 [Pikeienuella sp.]
MGKILMAAFGGMVLFFAYQTGGELEGRLFPVVGKITLSNPEAAPPPTYRTRWEGSADKHRDCEFIKLEWFLGPRNGRRVQVHSEFTDLPEVRHIGALSWDGLLIALDPAETLANSHADVLHQCPYRPWLTRTQFYDGEGG